MATFTELSDITPFAAYKVKLKEALKKVNANSDLNFAYFEKFAFPDKERALVLMDYKTDLVPKLPKKPNANGTGKCKLDDAGKLSFETAKGKVNIDKVGKLFVEAGVSLAVAHPEDRPNAPMQEPEGTKLNMKHGWTEIRKWGSDAQELIDAFDGLIGAYKGLPEIKPEWTDLQTRLTKVKEAMGAMLRAQIENDKEERDKLRVKVTTLAEAVLKLAAITRSKTKEEANKLEEESMRKQEPPKQEPPKQEPPKQEPQKPSAKPEITKKIIKDSVTRTNPRKNETLEKYVRRLQTSLEEDYGDATGKLVENLTDEAKASYFGTENPSTPNTPPTPPTATTPINWEDNVIDVNGSKANLSGFNSTEKNKILDIAMTGGANHHGNTVLSGDNPSCLHWRLGKLRIFGNVSNGKFTLIGTGLHSGKGNSSYKVDLLLGKTATATTA